jgi:hypothetical protein
MDHDASPAPGTRALDGDVHDLATLRISQAPEPGGGVMTEGGAVANREQRRRFGSPGHVCEVPDDEDRAVFTQ